MTFVTAVRKQTQQLRFGANSFKKLVIAQRTGRNVIEIRKKLRNVSGKLVTVEVEKIYRLFDMLSSFTASTHVRAENTRDNYFLRMGSFSVNSPISVARLCHFFCAHKLDCGRPSDSETPYRRSSFESCATDHAGQDELRDYPTERRRRSQTAATHTKQYDIERVAWHRNLPKLQIKQIEIELCATKALIVLLSWGPQNTLLMRRTLFSV